MRFFLFSFIDYASGQLYTTANDMNKWLSAMLNKGVGTIFTKDSIVALYTTCQEEDENGDTVDPCEYGVTIEILSNDMKADAVGWLEAFLDYD